MRRHAPGRRVRARIAIVAFRMYFCAERNKKKTAILLYCELPNPTHPLCCNGFSRKASIKKFHRLPRYKHRRSGQQGFFLVRFVHTQAHRRTTPHLLLGFNREKGLLCCCFAVARSRIYLRTWCGSQRATSNTYQAYGGDRDWELGGG